MDFNCLDGGAAAAAGKRAARAGGAVRSNVASTETASELVQAEGIALLGTPRPEGGLQMVPDVYSLNATFRKVNWSIVAEKTMEAEIGIPCDAFPGGMYLLRLVSGTMEETKKFILR